MGLNGDAASGNTGLELSEAWHEFRFFRDMFTFTYGKLDLSNYFDGNNVANDETAQFLSAGFINSTIIEWVDANPAARLTYGNSLLDLTFGWQSSAWEDIFDTPFVMTELNLHPTLGVLEGNYRLYWWLNSGDHTSYIDGTTDNDGSGLGISIDPSLMKVLSVFARAAIREGDLAEYVTDSAYSGGFALTGDWWGRGDNSQQVVKY